MPVVSAIITTFNRAAFLKEAAESVLKQSFEDIELLILDNSSTDNTEDVARSFNDNRIRYIKHEPMNISQARNLGVREATGRYVAFLDDDDQWLPCKTEEQLKVFEKNDSDLAMVYGGYIKTDTQGREFDVRKPTMRGRILRVMLNQSAPFTGSASNPMIRKSAIDELGGYNNEVVTGEDWELYLRLAEKHDIDFTDAPVVRICSHSGPRLCDKLEEQAQLELMLLARFSYVFEKDRKLMSYYLQRIGGKYIRVGSKEKGRTYLHQALKVYPLNYIAVLQYLLSILGIRVYQKVHSAYQSARDLM